MTAKVAALYIKALKLIGGQSESMWGLASAVLDGWLATVSTTTAPGSRAAATVRQQLQETQLLQHLSTAMDAAAARLTAAAAAALDAAAPATTGSSSGRSASTSPAASQCDSPMEELMSTVRCCRLLLSMFQELSKVISAHDNLSIAAALPAAPAAVRLMLTVLQANSRLQLMQQHTVQLPDDSSESCSTTSTVHSVMMMMAVMVGVNVSSTLQDCPAARELVLLPELL